MKMYFMWPIKNTLEGAEVKSRLFFDFFLLLMNDIVNRIDLNGFNFQTISTEMWPSNTFEWVSDFILGQYQYSLPYLKVSW